MKAIFCSSATAALLIFASSTPALHAQAPLLTIDTVLVGDAGNADASAANTTHGQAAAYGYGGVDYDYRIGTTEVTINQYVTFLNAVATNPSQPVYIAFLWNTNQRDTPNVAGITRGVANGSYVFSAIGDGNRPISLVTWVSAARFINWLNNGATFGASTETGVYNLNGAYSGIFTRQAGAQFWLPSEDEWYKAAYYDPTLNGGTGGYSLYANQSNSMTSHDLTVPGAANYTYRNPAPFGTPVYPGTGNKLTVADAYDTESYYGTFDQAGNVWEWSDTPYSDTAMAYRGGGYSTPEDRMQASLRTGSNTDVHSAAVGFRIAAAVPEPSAGVLLSLAVVGVCGVARRRRTSRIENDE